MNLAKATKVRSKATTPLESRTEEYDLVVLGSGEDIPGLFAARPMTHVELLELDYVPRRLIVLGGGFVGLELAQALRRFGSEVIVIDRHDRLLYGEDEDVSREMRQLMDAEGVQLRLGATPLGVSGQSGDSVNVRIVTDGAEESIEGSDLLVATGRIPNTRGIALEATGVKLLGNGYIEVNDRLETTATGVWAVGDCAGSPHFTHIAFDISYPSGQFLRRKPRYNRKAGPALPVHRSAVCPRRPDRNRRSRKKDQLPLGKDSDGGGSAYAHSFRKERILESADRGGQRQAPGLCRDWS